MGTFHCSQAVPATNFVWPYYADEHDLASFWFFSFQFPQLLFSSFQTVVLQFMNFMNCLSSDKCKSWFQGWPREGVCSGSRRKMAADLQSSAATTALMDLIVKTINLLMTLKGISCVGWLPVKMSTLVVFICRPQLTHISSPRHSWAAPLSVKKDRKYRSRRNGDIFVFRNVTQQKVTIILIQTFLLNLLQFRWPFFGNQAKRWATDDLMFKQKPVIHLRALRTRRTKKQVGMNAWFLLCKWSMATRRKTRIVDR